MPQLDWHEAIDAIHPHVVKISTPGGTGTGWLVSRSSQTPLRAIATAAHVIDHAHYWEQPIRIFHPATGESVMLREEDRAIQINESIDTAAIIFEGAEIAFPDAALRLTDRDKYLKQGVEIGWLGFPAVSSGNLCFFSGRISAYLGSEAAYLVDGVAINGVSGGPVFRLFVDEPEMIGIVSAYIPNRATGETLPGVALVRDVAEYHDLVAQFQSLDDAKAQESPPSSAPPPPPEPDGAVGN